MVCSGMQWCATVCYSSDATVCHRTGARRDSTIATSRAPSGWARFSWGHTWISYRISTKSFPRDKLYEILMNFADCAKNAIIPQGIQLIIENAGNP